MSELTVCVCEGCGKRVDNRYAEPGWIHISPHNANSEVSITRAVGHYDKKMGCYQTDYLTRVKDFCSLDCLKAALDKAAESRKKNQ